MTDTDSITERILEKAKSHGEDLLKEAREKHDNMLRESLETAKREVSEHRDAEKKRLHEKHEQMLSNRRLEQRSKTHTLKRRLIDDVFKSAWEAVRGKANYAKYVENELDRYTQPGDTLIVSAGDADLFAQELKATLKRLQVGLSEERGRITAGFIVPRGNTRLNCSLDQRFRELTEEEQIQVARMLFER